MSTFDGNNHYYSGQGVVMIASRDVVTGKPTGFLPLGNVSDLKILIQTSVIEHKESQTGQRGIDLRLVTETKCNMSMTVDNYIAANLSLALRGVNTASVGGTVTGEAVNGYSGLISSLAHIKVAAAVVKLGATVLTPFVDNATPYDYKINLAAGSIYLNDGVAPNPAVVGLTGGTAGAPIALTVDYTYSAQNVIDALTVGAQERYLRFEGLNTADTNSPVVIEVFKFSVDPLKELSLITDTVQQFVLDGSVLADPLRTSGSKYFKETALR